MELNDSIKTIKGIGDKTASWHLPAWDRDGERSASQLPQDICHL